MNAKHLALIIPVVLALTACSSDNDTDMQRTPVVQISGASVKQSVGTRTSENTDATQSQFTSGDAIAVVVGPNTGTYQYDGSKWTATTAVHWATFNGQETVTAYCPSTVATSSSIADQSNGIAYYLKASQEATAGQAVSLTFTHQLAKVRLVIKNQAALVQSAYVYGSTTVTRDASGVITGSADGWITMHAVTIDGSTVYEATVVPGTITKIKLNGDESTISEIKTEAAGLYTLNVTLEPK